MQRARPEVAPHELRGWARLLGALVLATLGHGCGSTLADGELGLPRVVGFLRGAPPDVQVYAPVSDRSGNIYVLSGRRDNPLNVNAFVARSGGGFTSGCTLTKGDKVGPIGWVGSSTEQRFSNGTGSDRFDRQWYWSGSALVSLSASGDCRRVLDRDPSTGTELFFDAVIPWVNDQTTRTTLVGLVRAASDAAPFTILVDLNARIYSTPRAFEPPSATQVVVHGTGARPELKEGFVLASFRDGGGVRTEGRFYDVDGTLTVRSAIAGASKLTPYGIRGFLQESDAGLVAGLTDDKRLVVFDHSGGQLLDVGGMDPVGVHLWKGQLYVVGTANGRPVVSSILNNGDLGSPIVWGASQRVQSQFVPGLVTTDDRTPPRRTTRFDEARSVGAFPFVTEHSLDVFASDTTLVGIAGPTFGEGENAFTLVAVAPAGISYP